MHTFYFAKNIPMKDEPCRSVTFVYQMPKCQVRAKKKKDRRMCDLNRHVKKWTDIK